MSFQRPITFFFKVLFFWIFFQKNNGLTVEKYLFSIDYGVKIKKNLVTKGYLFYAD